MQIERVQRAEHGKAGPNSEATIQIFNLCAYPLDLRKWSTFENTDR